MLGKHLDAEADNPPFQRIKIATLVSLTEATSPTPLTTHMTQMSLLKSCYYLNTFGSCNSDTFNTFMIYNLVYISVNCFFFLSLKKKQLTEM